MKSPKDTFDIASTALAPSIEDVMDQVPGFIESRWMETAQQLLKSADVLERRAMELRAKADRLQKTAPVIAKGLSDEIAYEQNCYNVSQIMKKG